MIMVRMKDTHVLFGGFPSIGHKELYVVDPYDVNL
jgi:hypothetical protein